MLTACSMVHNRATPLVLRVLFGMLFASVVLPLCSILRMVVPTALEIL